MTDSLTPAGEDSPVLVRHYDSGVSVITLNRPDKRNAMNRAARSSLMTALDECRTKAKVILLTGNGPAFCAGIDLKEAESEGKIQGKSDTRSDRSYEWRAVQEAIRCHPAIVIAVVNGFALGGGVTLINASDLAIAAEDAQIGMPEVGFGLYPGLAGPSTQLRLPAKRAAWLVLTTQRIDGRVAQEWGLVNLAVPGEILIDEAMVIAEQIARHNAVTLQWSKKALWEIPMHVQDWTAALEFGEHIGAEIRARSDVVTRGLKAFAAGTRNPGQGATQ